MNTLTLTDADFDSTGIYIGKTDITSFNGNLKIEANYARFLKFVKVTGFIEADGYIAADGYIEAGSYIEARGSSKAGYFIKAGRYIAVDGYIEAGDSIEAGNSIKAGDSIKAGSYIEAAGYIEAGSYIEAGNSIKSGGYIKAGNSIKADLTITCKELSAKWRIFAGVCTWKVPEESETLITCQKLINGTVAYGKLNIIEKKETLSCAGKVVEIDGKKYKLVEA
jgi:UDP-3-O-[3-hydroxymyristoyl] glucosamine N-acyltransferase